MKYTAEVTTVLDKQYEVTKLWEVFLKIKKKTSMREARVEIWGSDGDDVFDCCILCCDAVWTCRWLQIARPHSGVTNQKTTIEYLELIYSVLGLTLKYLIYYCFIWQSIFKCSG
jgi:hypothetical protein